MNIKTSVLVACAFVVISVLAGHEALAQQVERLSIAADSEVRFGGPWRLSDVKYGNAKELVIMRAAPATPEAKVAEFPVARMMITVEQRSSAEDALRRLESVAAARENPAEFIEVGGWPAVKIVFSEELARRGPNAGLESSKITAERTITAIAENDKVVVFDTYVLPDAPDDSMKSAEEIALTATFENRAAPESLQKALENLRSNEQKRQLLLEQGPPPEPKTDLQPTPDLGIDSTADDQPPAPAAATGVPVRVQGGVGEIEVAASANARNVVIASNANLSFSTNGGTTFAAGATGVFGLNDPTLARANSGDFYLGVIAFPTGTAAQLNVTGCTNAVSRSTDNGANFALQGYSAVCPNTGAGICFPDQEHIAADARNQSSGNDQVYAVWRNFTPAGAAAACGNIGTGFVSPSITCSQDNGVNWTARAAINGGGDFPRVAVGRDGDVYVVTVTGNSVLLNRYSSCANGLAARAGYPVTVATLSGGVNCPIAGLDRCNNGNVLSSPTVAPDPDHSAHLFVAFSENNGGNSERVVVMESYNRGATFPYRRNVSNSASVRRFMPWSCATRGRAWVGWYDRANADLTEYFLGSSDGRRWNLTNNPDPQCASGWPCAPRSINDSESCPVQPQLAGRCLTAGGGGSQNPCDFSTPGCPPGETCTAGGGCPKYGDYNGVACAGRYVFTAWSSATAPSGLPAAAGIGVYSERRLIDRFGQVHFWPMTNGTRTGGINVHTPVDVRWSLRGVGDVNGDGTADVIWQHDNGQVHYWPMNNGARTGGINTHTPVGVAWNLRGIGDVNGDGTDDIVWRHKNGQVHYWPMSNGARTGGINIHTPVGVAWNLEGVGDVNGDDTDDIIWRHKNGQVHYWPMDNGARTGGINIHTPVGVAWNLEGVGDVNGDGTDDIIWQLGNSEDTADIVWQRNDGQVHFWRIETARRLGGIDVHTPVGSNWTLKGTGDVNGDGTADVIWQHNNGQVHYWPMDNGKRTGGVNIHTPVGSNWSLRAIGDVNGDGTDDIIWRHSNGQVHYWPMDNGARTGGINIHSPVGAAWTLEGAGDVNGDGTDDIVWRHDNGQVHYWPMDDGKRTGGINIHTPVGGNWSLKAVGDVNGDETADIVWQHNSGRVHYWPMDEGKRTGGIDIHIPVGNNWELVGAGDLT